MVAELIKKIITCQYAAYKRLTSDQKDRLKVKGQKKIFHTNRNKKNAGVTILVSDKIRLQNKDYKKRQKRHNIILKRSINPRGCNNCKYLCTQLAAHK